METPVTASQRFAAYVAGVRFEHLPAPVVEAAKVWILDTLGDGRTQLGLTIMSDFFNADGWVWGAGYGREDSMHFEVSKEKIEAWVAAGQI